MREAEDAAAAYARATFQQVDAATALIAVGGQLRIPEDPEFGHWMISLAHCRHACESQHGSRRSHDTHRRAEVRWVPGVGG